jgi:hypothetical protein
MIQGNSGVDPLTGPFADTAQQIVEAMPKSILKSEPPAVKSEPESEPEAKPSKLITVQIDPPAFVTLEMWSTYIEARQQYLLSERSYGDVFTQDFIGGIELIRRGWFHIKAPEQVMKYIDPYLSMKDLTHINGTPLVIMQLVVRNISRIVEGALNAPLPDGSILLVE